jgi:hypothetical protein
LDDADADAAVDGLTNAFSKKIDNHEVAIALHYTPLLNVLLHIAA